MGRRRGRRGEEGGSKEGEKEGGRRGEGRGEGGEKEGEKGWGEGRGEGGDLHVVLLELCCLQHLLEHSGGVSEIGQNFFWHLLRCTQLNHAVGRRTLWTRRSSLLPANPAHKVSTAGQVEASAKQRVRMAPASTAQDSPLHWYVHSCFFWQTAHMNALSARQLRDVYQVAGRSCNLQLYMLSRPL